MSCILNIDTSNNYLYVSVSEANEMLAEKFISETHNQASLLHISVQEVLQSAQLEFKQLYAIAVLNGPGSYTGLRVSLASAKGYCMALNLPLITISNLFAQAVCYLQNNSCNKNSITSAFAPMHNEIIYTEYTVDNIFNEASKNALYLKNANEFLLNENSILICKNAQHIVDIPFAESTYLPSSINKISNKLFLQKNFANLISAEPHYIKEPFITAKK